MIGAVSNLKSYLLYCLNFPIRFEWGIVIVWLLIHFLIHFFKMLPTYTSNSAGDE